jgi:bifunctional non-homologous end joining protein LigD
MALTTYNRKRNFGTTNEPKGTKGKSRTKSIFVVQKHDASHLHYDFRLEVMGTLKSWAVPKGPSMDPGEKRLAMMVEDHPYTYKDFEGTIPEGNYGAGNVIVWDNGTYHEIGNPNKASSEKAIAAGIHKGHISFTLEGRKLKGEFSLVKVKGKQDNAWLLIKRDDKYASKEDILEKDRSVISRKKLVPRKRPASKNVAKKKSPHSAISS